MACKKCNDCKDNGCAPSVYPKCLLMDKKYVCLGVNVGDTAVKLFDALEAACQAGWGGSSITLNNGLTLTGSVGQLGGTLIKNTIVDTKGFDLAIGSNTNPTYLYGTFYGETINGPATPGATLGIAAQGGNDGSRASTLLLSGSYYGLWEVYNGNNLAQLTLTNKNAHIKFSPDKGTTNVVVKVDNNEITLDGQGRRTIFDLTQSQEAASASIASASVLEINTTGNLFPISGNTAISAITGPGAVLTNIQAGTRITLQFSEVAPGIVQNAVAAPIGAASIYLTGCVDFAPSQGDTLSLIYNGQDWSEIGRKMCFNSAWTSPDLSGNVFVTNNFNTRYRKVDANHVELNIYLDAVIPGFVFYRGLYTLPAGHWPQFPMYLPCTVYDIGAPNSNYKAVVWINTTGDVAIYVLDTIPANTNVTLGGFTGIFPTD